MAARLSVREANSSDADSIVALFLEEGTNLYGWNKEKWCHYYQDYPEGEPVSLVLELSGIVIGHYGLLPVKISGWPVMLGLHAYVAQPYRGLSGIATLMKGAEKIVQQRGFAAICGFANPSFSLIKEKLFNWKTIVWLGFDDNLNHINIEAGNQCDYYFQYTEKWFSWRFGAFKKIYLSDFTDRDGVEHTQCLKVHPSLNKLKPINLSGVEAWTKKRSYPSQPDSVRAQPFSIKIYSEKFSSGGALDYRKWKIDMGDSDTFFYNPSSKLYVGDC